MINSNTPGKISVQRAIIGEFGRNDKQAESRLQQLQRVLWAARSQKAAPVWLLLFRNWRILHVSSELGLKSWKKPHISVELTPDKGTHAQRSDIYIRPTIPYAQILNSLNTFLNWQPQTQLKAQLKATEAAESKLKTRTRGAFGLIFTLLMLIT